MSSGGGSDGGHVTSGGGGGSEYLKQLQALNVGVSKWISSHVEKNPHVDLTPIFKDYEKHLKAIDLKVWPSTPSCERRGILLFPLIVPQSNFYIWGGGGGTRCHVAFPYGT